MDLWPLACWDCGFESLRGHGYLSLVSVVCHSVAARFKTWICGHSLVGTAGSNPSVGTDICLWRVLGVIQWPRDLRRGSVATRLLGLRIRIPPGARISVSGESCVSFSPITRPEESHREWRV
jgi:hypothetical protein